jgi:hypothetical protein
MEKKFNPKAPSLQNLSVREGQSLPGSCQSQLSMNLQGVDLLNLIDWSPAMPPALPFQFIAVFEFQVHVVIGDLFVHIDFSHLTEGFTNELAGR